MDESTITIKIIAGILTVVLVGIAIMRRKNKPKNTEDEF